MVALAIAMLLVGISFNFIGRAPSGLLLRNSAADIESFLSSAKNQALFQNKRISVFFNPETRSFIIKSSTVENPSVSCRVEGHGDYSLPDGVGMECPNGREDEVPVCVFFPDGTSSGGDIRVFIKKRSVVISISQLTGSITIKPESVKK